MIYNNTTANSNNSAKTSTHNSLKTLLRKHLTGPQEFHLCVDGFYCCNLIAVVFRWLFLLLLGIFSCILFIYTSIYIFVFLYVSFHHHHHHHSRWYFSLSFFGFFVSFRCRCVAGDVCHRISFIFSLQQLNHDNFAIVIIIITFVFFFVHFLFSRSQPWNSHIIFCSEISIVKSSTLNV